MVYRKVRLRLAGFERDRNTSAIIRLEATAAQAETRLTASAVHNWMLIVDGAPRQASLW